MDKVAAVLEPGIPDSNQTDSRDSGDLIKQVQLNPGTTSMCELTLPV